MKRALARSAAWVWALGSWISILVRGGFGSLALLRRSLDGRPHRGEHLPGRPTAFLFRWLVLLRWWRGRNDVHADLARLYLRRAHRELPRDPCEAEPVEIFDIGEIDPQRFRETWRRDVRPVVVRGLRPGARDWSLAGLQREFGETRVWARDSDRFAWERLDRIEPGDTRYVANSEQLLLRHPELVGRLDVARYGAFVGGRPYAIQLFLGARTGTGLTFHCANNLNLFTMLHGRKRWTFVDPAYSYAMYPWITRSGAYVASILDHPEIPRAHTELFTGCPRLEITLEPGDVLFSPPWWWHRVENLDPDTVGAASRWAVPGLPDANRLFTFAQLASGELLRATAETLGVLIEHGGDLEARYGAVSRAAVPTAIETVAHTDEQLLPGELGRACWSRG